MRCRSVFSLLLPLTLSLACRPTAPDSKFVSEWLHLTRALVADARVSPPVAARVAAYGSIALYEGYAADPRSRLQSLAGQLNGLWSVPLVGEHVVDGAVVAAEAQRVVLDSLLGGGAAARRSRDSLAAAHVDARRRDGVRGSLRDRSLAHGRELAKALLVWAANDGFLTTRRRQWSAPRTTGRWAPPSTGAMEPHWGALRTFALRSGDECSPPTPPAYSEATGSPFWKMGKQFMDSLRSPGAEQVAKARFWTASAEAGEGPGLHWTTVVADMIERRRLTADQAAEVRVLAAVAIADAYIGCWREKYRTLVVRPETFVRRTFDARWPVLGHTPAHPEYPSDHAAIAGAVAEVLMTSIGDSIPFDVSTSSDAGSSPRSFRHFAQARDEAAAAGLYAGLQYVPSVVNGLAQGQCIGRRVLGRLRTRSEPATATP